MSRYSNSTFLSVDVFVVHLVDLDELFYKRAYSALQNQGTVQDRMNREWSNLGPTFERHITDFIGPLRRSLTTFAIDSFDSVFDAEHESDIRFLS